MTTIRMLGSEAGMRRLFAASIAALALGLALPAQASEVVTREFASTALARQWAYEVYLPSQYVSSRHSYPVLYLLHGNNGTRHDWMRQGKIQATADALIASGAIPPAIVVMPDAAASWVVNSGARRAGVFGSDFDEGVWRSLNYPALWDAYLARKTPVAMYINSGDDDEFFIEAEAVKLYALLRANRQPAELRIVNGAHAWTVWESTIGDAMKYVFRFAKQPAPVE